MTISANHHTFLTPYTCAHVHIYVHAHVCTCARTHFISSVFKASSILPQPAIPLQDSKLASAPEMSFSQCIAVPHLGCLSRTCSSEKSCLVSLRNPVLIILFLLKFHWAIPEIRDRLNSPVTALPQGRCWLSSYWFHMSEIACSRVSSATPQGRSQYRCSSAPDHEETQPMPDGTLSLLPAMPLCQPKERSQFRSHEVTWDSDSFAHPIIIDFLLCVVSLLIIR